MVNYVYDTYSNYFNALKKTGHISIKTVKSLLVLEFIYNLMYNDYRGYVSREDYHTIEKMLNCLYGSNCLMSYPNYLKMGKLKLGETIELATRTKNLEKYSKELDQRILDNDALISDSIRRIDEHGTRLDSHDVQLALHGATLENHEGRLSTVEHEIYGSGTGLADRMTSAEGRLTSAEGRLDTDERAIADHEGRIADMETIEVAKPKTDIKTIPDIVIE